MPDDSLTEVDDSAATRVDIDEPLAWQKQRYEELGRIGAGGMGEIRVCKDTRISREVAVKTLRKRFRDDPAYRSRFLLEARLQGQLEHPAIVPVHDLGETDEGELYFTMKRIRGVTLASMLEAARKAETRSSLRRMLTAFSSVCLAVDFAHSRGVVHRDLKPENIMIGDFGEVYVLDWGIAKLIGAPDDAVGTPLYMAPERKQGTLDPRSDVFSLGVILGAILESGDFDIPPELAAISRRAAYADPSQRFASARELHTAIEGYLDGDRDLEARRSLALEHVKRAERALDDATADRATAGREIGRALGLDPSNTRALRMLMRLLSDLPEQLPAAAQAEIDQRWLERRARTMRIGTFMVLSMLVIVPFILWAGVLDWRLFAAFIGLVLTTSALLWRASHTSGVGWFAAAYVSQMSAIAILSLSSGVLGFVPAMFTIVIVAWRMTVHRTLPAVLMLLTALLGLLLPFILSIAGVVRSVYTFRDGSISLAPNMHALPPLPTLLSLVIVTFGVLSAASIYARVFVGEIRRAESTLTFHAWQLRQLVPPEHVT